MCVWANNLPVLLIDLRFFNAFVLGAPVLKITIKSLSKQAIHSVINKHTDSETKF